MFSSERLRADFAMCKLGIVVECASTACNHTVWYVIFIWVWDGTTFGIVEILVIVLVTIVIMICIVLLILVLRSCLTEIWPVICVFNVLTIDSLIINVEIKLYRSPIFIRSQFLQAHESMICCCRYSLVQRGVGHSVVRQWVWLNS